MTASTTTGPAPGKPLRDDRSEGAASASGLDKSSRRIREMFAGVAPRYDLLNRVLSARFDQLWRRRVARALDLPAGSRVADLCCGTGDQALALERLGLRVTAADFCLPMLDIARRKYLKGRRRAADRPRGLAGDSVELPFPSSTFAGATVSFGLRNVADLDRALREMARILAPGGRVAILECTVPEGLLRRPYLVYFRHILPRIGKLLSPRGSAYSYLTDSVLEFPQRAELTDRMERAGFTATAWTNLTAGIACVYTGERAA